MFSVPKERLMRSGFSLKFLKTRILAAVSRTA